MFHSIQIENFRRFTRYELHDLGRVNLLVGTNNSGKTSILEAVQMLVSCADSLPVFNALWRRGEQVHEAELQGPQTLAAIRHLFHGHEIAPSSNFAMQGHGDRNLSLIATIKEPRQQSLAAALGLGLLLQWNGDQSAEVFLPITNRHGIARTPPRLPGPQEARVPGGYFLESSSLSKDEVVEHLDAVALTSEEDLVVQSLQLIEPDIERIASVSEGGSRNGRGGIVVRCRGQQQRVPIGSMGDGIWRMLGLVLTLVHSERGCLLVDEIDTGFHYTVLEKMWRLVTEVARRLNVQVFATTHSNDCWTSLAAVVRETDATDVSIQRIEPDTQKAVAFSAEEMVLAAERGIEVR
jgi:predicted ATPase